MTDDVYPIEGKSEACNEYTLLRIKRNDIQMIELEK